MTTRTAITVAAFHGRARSVRPLLPHAVSACARRLHSRGTLRPSSAPHAPRVSESARCSPGRTGQHCAGLLTVHNADAGLHVAALLPSGLDDRDVIRRMVERGLTATALSSCYAGKRKPSGLWLGFGGTDRATSHRSDARARRGAARGGRGGRVNSWWWLLSWIAARPPAPIPAAHPSIVDTSRAFEPIARTPRGE